VNGDTERTCQETGWSGQGPTCTRGSRGELRLNTQHRHVYLIIYFK